MTPRMKDKWRNEVKGELKQAFDISNDLALPRMEKIVLSVGMGRSLEGAKLNPAHREVVVDTLSSITGQKPVMVKSKKSVSNFKVRIGYETGAMVTLRGDRMWEFFDRLVTLAIPRIKDFRGLKRSSFDHAGNYSFGVTEQAIFPEVDIANARHIHGMHITIGFRNSDREKSEKAMELLGFPFVRSEKEQQAA